MEIGLCTSPQAASQLPASAFDFIEAHVQEFLLPEGSEADFSLNLKAAKALPKPIRAANCFLPADLKCVGPKVDHDRLMRYTETVFRRAQKAGIEIIVIGSSVSRAVPDNFFKADTMNQFTRLLKMFGVAAEYFGVTIVVEPLNSHECNFINTLAEGAEAVMLADHPNVRLLADIFHMRMEKEPVHELVRFGHLVKHAHVSEQAERGWPGKAGEDLSDFYEALKTIHYTGGLAIESKWNDFTTDAEPSLNYLRKQLTNAGL
jgi:sugar phosphate isomerase/epimerase